METLTHEHVPALLREIPDPPEKLYLKGKLPSTTARSLAVVGSRKYTSYGKQVVETLVGGLRGHNIAIISGLALGIDALAHEAALHAGLYTLAVPGSGLNDDVLYPAKHRRLAARILEADGGLLSEFEPDFKATTWSFPQRNRIMAGLSHGVLVIEAQPKSGTLITARLAVEYNRDVLAVPGSIFSEHTKGPHMLMRLGATPVSSSEDILEALGIESDTQNEKVPPAHLSELEKNILEALTEPKEKDELLHITGIPAHQINTTLSLMELNDLVAIDGNKVRKK